MLASLILLMLSATLAYLADEETRWIGAFAAVIAASAACGFPDLDQILPLGHRSGLTHSILPAGLACLWRSGRAFAAGLALGIGFHLSADLFPEAMRGFATIKLPFAGSIGWQASYVWIGLNAFACLTLGALLLGGLLGPKLALGTLAVVGLIGIAYLFTVDGGWWALSMFGATAWLALRIRQPGNRSNLGN